MVKSHLTIISKRDSTNQPRKSVLESRDLNWKTGEEQGLHTCTPLQSFGRGTHWSVTRKLKTRSHIQNQEATSGKI
jgi:hypothetical protein